VCATDGSPGGDRAIDLASALANATHARLLILTVGNNLAGDEVKELARVEGSVGEAHELIANQILEWAKQRAQSCGASSVETLFSWGDPAQVIIETARSHNADVIVVGRRGRGRLAGLLLGSVSQKLVSLAPCAVVVVP
jgi:nucleotide-binding universal stress UspA family protein